MRGTHLGSPTVFRQPLKTPRALTRQSFTQVSHARIPEAERIPFGTLRDVVRLSCMS